MRLLLGAWLVVVSTACGYQSPVGPTPAPPDVTTPATLRLDATPATVTAVVHNSLGAPLAAVAVAFTVDVGTIDASAVTSADGTARVTLTAPAGPARVTATAGALVTSALVAVQPAPVGDTTPPSVAPAPTPAPGPVPLTVAITAAPRLAGTPSTFGLVMNAELRSASWDFGDGGAVTTTSASTTHVYAVGGYAVAVVVTDSRGRTASAQTMVHIP